MTITVRERAAVVQDTAAAQQLAGCLRWRYGDSPDSAERRRARRGASARTTGTAHQAGTDTQAQHLPPPTQPSVGRRWRVPAIRRPFWLGPTQPRRECAHPMGWARRAMDIAMFLRHRHARATARGTQVPRPPSLCPFSSPPSPCRVLWDWVGSATQITRSLETRTESPRLPLSLQQCHSASRRFPLV